MECAGEEGKRLEIVNHLRVGQDCLGKGSCLRNINEEIAEFESGDRS